MNRQGAFHVSVEPRASVSVQVPLGSPAQRAVGSKSRPGDSADRPVRAIAMSRWRSSAGYVLRHLAIVDTSYLSESEVSTE